MRASKQHDSNAASCEAVSRRAQVAEYRAKLRKLRPWPDAQKRFIEWFRDEALTHLEPLLASIPRGMPDRITSAYDAKGISTEWRLLDPDDAWAFARAAHRTQNLSSTQKSAIDLLEATSRALRGESFIVVDDLMTERILDAYAGLDPTLALGEKFSAGRKIGTVGPVRKVIARELKKNPQVTNAVIWDVLKRKPPKGWRVYENSRGKYIEGPKAADNMSIERFRNIAAEERKLLKERYDRHGLASP